MGLVGDSGAVPHRGNFVPSLGVNGMIARIDSILAIQIFASNLASRLNLLSIPEFQRHSLRARPLSFPPRPFRADPTYIPSPSPLTPQPSLAGSTRRWNAASGSRPR